MVSPKRPTRRVESSSSNSYMVFFVKVLFVLVILFMLPSMVEGGSRRRRREKKNRRSNAKTAIVYRRRLDCEADCMERIIYAEEAMNCIQECVSPTCFQEIYETPLEPGEIDLNKAKRLQTCAEQEVVDTRKVERQKKKEEKENQ
ncbi:unnamed protein product [Cylindrotheca closterium]|uniref:Uncharacterized protein n=1 Tax=Cylindrotheca closterium TaxID=2856 RepID=A0AAD2G7M0_9STRA|nr:unnamed protein product [Cylindrotheca closterium]